MSLCFPVNGYLVRSGRDHSSQKKRQGSRNAADGRVRMHLAGGGTGRGMSVGPARRPAHAPSGLESANDLDNML